MYVMRQGSGDAVLFLHGIPTSCRLWDGIIERMGNEFTCIAVDLPGLGRTADTPHGFRELDSLAKAIDCVRVECGVEKWHLVGHDAGCAIAVQYAYQFPDRVGCLALLTPSIFPELKPFFLFEILRTRFLGEMLAPLVGVVFWRIAMRLAIQRDERTDQAVRAFHAPFRGWRGARRLLALVRWGSPRDVLGQFPVMLPRIQAPALILHGSDDPAVPASFARRAAALIPDARMAMLESGHFLPLNEPRSIAEMISEFFGSRQSMEPQLAAAAAAVD